jgi:hypothetical protein
MGNDKLTIYLAGKMSGLDKEEYNGWRKSITEDLIAYARSCGSNVQVINPADTLILTTWRDILKKK